ncbi:MAG: GSCFA domain-containing protein, partial [Muribaculaceae bacterium]|nr:GSCFA domain-containing protein [Muribaculaceae bacterium]
VSPVRHTADGLHGNNLSKATLMLAVEALDAEYFPAYEIVCDDLRDYRFYAADLKHPSDEAVEYIYEKYAGAYFSPATLEILRQRHAAILREAHRPGNNIL